VEVCVGIAGLKIINGGGKLDLKMVHSKEEEDNIYGKRNLTVA
jgi:hypothetical protein